MAKLELVAPFFVAVIFAARLATYEPSRDVKPGRVIDGEVVVNASNIRSFDDVVEIRGHLVIDETALTEINLRDFPRLKNVTGNIYIEDNVELVSLASAFPSLEFANGLFIETNSQLKSITASFPRLKHETEYISISGNALLATITSSFTRLERIIDGVELFSNPSLTTVTNSFNAYNGTVCWGNNGVALNNSGLDLEHDCNAP